VLEYLVLYVVYTFLSGTIPPGPAEGGIVSLTSVREFPVKID
jgi:hypothetical protein